MDEDFSVFSAMNEFANIAQAVALTSSEVALFYTLLQTWNVARRPAVIEQWARTTKALAGLTDETLCSARNKLVQRGILYFAKNGTRGVPRYSLHAIFGLPSPFVCSDRYSVNQGVTGGVSDLLRKSGRNGRSKDGVTDGVKADSYQGEDKDKEREREGAWARVVDVVRLYPKALGEREAVEVVGEHLRQGEYALEEVEAGTRAIVAVIERLPSGARNRFVMGANRFFREQRWRDDPEAWLAMVETGREPRAGGYVPSEGVSRVRPWDRAANDGVA